MYKLNNFLQFGPVANVSYKNKKDKQDYLMCPHLIEPCPSSPHHETHHLCLVSHYLCVRARSQLMA